MANSERQAINNPKAFYKLWGLSFFIGQLEEGEVVGPIKFQPPEGGDG